jgi:formylglycine-generating enzyme required for sulfatase activity
MGSSDSDPAAGKDEKPQRRVYVDAFWIDRTEITNGQYQRCVAAGVCASSNVYNKDFGEETLPVVGVNWQQANAYCHWVGGRLPSEAEWEKAARGVDGRLYPWGNQFDGYRLNYCDASCVADWRDQSANDGYRYTAPVGSFPGGASPYGVLDMSGNVWEWTADWYASDTYVQSTTLNPTGPAFGVQRVIRGGSWLYKGAGVRVARRHKDTPASSYDNIGFRCVVVEAEQAHWQPDRHYRGNARVK